MPNEPMTEERLAEIRGREKAATQGPWKAGKDDFTKNIIQAAKDRGTIIVQRMDDYNMFWNSYIPIEQTFADADFIAHAREDIPALLDEVERLREENEALKLRVCERQERFVAQNWRNVEQKRYSFKKFRVFKYN